MIEPEVVVIDYGVGNLLSVQRGLEHCGAKVTLTSDPEKILAAKRVVLPGVGAFGNAMEALHSLDLVEAIRELADVLEFIRPAIKEHLNKKDENDIFNIANNFGIRHHNKDQQTEYDKAIWYSWIFYYYLATLHAVLRMTNKK